MALRPEQPGLSPAGCSRRIRPSAPDAGAPPGPVAPLLYRLWATRAESGESVLLEESRGPLTSPSWSPDGLALAFGRLVPEEEGRGRFEVVIQEAPDRKRVVLARPVNEFHARATELPGLGLAWSPDGRYLAVPLFQQTLCLGIIRADNGRVLKVIEDAYLPAWSPDGTKLAFVQGSDAESLHYIEHDFGPPRHLADIGQTSQAPVWYRDSRSVAVLARRTAQLRRREPPAQQIDLLRVQIESGQIELINNLLSEPGDRDKAVQRIVVQSRPRRRRAVLRQRRRGTAHRDHLLPSPDRRDGGEVSPDRPVGPDRRAGAVAERQDAGVTGRFAGRTLAARAARPGQQGVHSAGARRCRAGRVARDPDPHRAAPAPGAFAHHRRAEHADRPAHLASGARRAADQPRGRDPPPPNRPDRPSALRPSRGCTARQRRLAPRAGRGAAVLRRSPRRTTPPPSSRSKRSNRG